MENCLELKADDDLRVIFNSELIFSNRKQQNWEDLWTSVNLICCPCHSSFAHECFPGKAKARLDGLEAPWAMEGVPARAGGEWDEL